MEELKYLNEIRDPVHGLIKLTELEVRVIDTRAYQRLRGVKQLALASLGFPGAIHTRFEHGLGVMHVSGLLMDHFRNIDGAISSETIEDVRLAGLLHDIGHGPFSHITEYVLKRVRGNDREVENTEEIHELISQSIIRNNPELVDVLGQQQADRIAALLNTDNPNSDYTHDIVSGPLDADKMDYLLRDSYFAGVSYGVFDLHRLINVLELVEEGGKKRLAVKKEGIPAVEQYIIAKYFLSQQVYGHKTRLVTDHMIIEGILASIGEENEELRMLYTFREEDDYISNYLRWDDQKVTRSVLEHSPGNRGFAFFDALRQRKLLKVLYESDTRCLSLPRTKEASRLWHELKKGGTDNLSDLIRQRLGDDFEFVKLDTTSAKLPFCYSNADEEILVKLESGTTSLQSESNLYNNVANDPKPDYIHVFGRPVGEGWNKGKQNELSRVLKSVIERYFEG